MTPRTPSTIKDAKPTSLYAVRHGVKWEPRTKPSPWPVIILSALTVVGMCVGPFIVGR